MITPCSDTNEEREASDFERECNGDPGAIRTRDPQLRRLFRKSCNLPVLLRYSENLVRSGSARRCHRVTRPRRAAQKLRKLTLYLDQLMQAGQSNVLYTVDLRMRVPLFGLLEDLVDSSGMRSQ